MSFLVHFLFGNVLLNFYKFVNFQNFLLLCIYNLILLWLKTYLAWFLIFKIYWDMHTVYLEEFSMCTWSIVFCSNWVFCRCLSGVGIYRLFKSSVFSLVFHLVLLFIIESEVLEFSTIIAELSFSPFNFISCYFIYFGSLLLGVCIYIYLYLLYLLN